MPDLQTEPFMGEELSLFKVDNPVGRVGRFYPTRQICIAFYCRVQCQLLNTTYKLLLNFLSSLLFLIYLLILSKYKKLLQSAQT